MSKTHTPPLFFHLHQYAAETMSVIANLETMQAFNAGEMAGALIARGFAAFDALPEETAAAA